MNQRSSAPYDDCLDEINVRSGADDNRNCVSATRRCTANTHTCVFAPMRILYSFAQCPAKEQMDELDPVFSRVASYFGLLSEPIRLRIVHAICLEEKSVNEIAASTGASQTATSRHLSRMLAGGAVARRRQGNQTFYRVADTTLLELCREVCGRIAAEIDEQQPLRKDLLGLLPRRSGTMVRGGARHERKVNKRG